MHKAPHLPGRPRTGPAPFSQGFLNRLADAERELKAKARTGIYPGREWDAWLDPDIEALVTERGGQTITGLPNFRVVWGGKRHAWRGGENAQGKVGYFWDPKYWPKFERWHVEMWLPPGHFGDLRAWERETTEWIRNRKVYMLGPYPSEGEYEQLRCLDGPPKEKGKNTDFLPLVPEVVEMLLRLVEFSKSISHSHRRAMKVEEKAKIDRENEAQDERVLMGTRLAFHGQPMVGYTPEDKRKDKYVVTRP